MQDLFDSPFAPTVLACVIAGLAVGGIARLARLTLLANLAAPVTFLVAYYETYNKIPDFPPVGSTNKIFYIALFAAAAGVALDLLAPARIARWVLLAAPLPIAIWIGLPRFADPSAAFALEFLALVVGGAFMLWRVAALAGRAAPDGGPLVAGGLLAVLPGVFAPIALFGASSTSVGLCLGLAAGLAVGAGLTLWRPMPVGLTAVLGAGGGLLAVIDTVTLITQRVDPVALVLFLAVLVAGQAGGRWLLPADRPGPRLRGIAQTLLAATPVVAILVLLFLTHESPL